MRSANLQLTLSEPHFTLTPLSPHSISHCTHAEGCRRLATHRLLSRPEGVALLCDVHTLAFAQEHRSGVTTARIEESAA